MDNRQNQKVEMQMQRAPVIAPVYQQPNNIQGGLQAVKQLGKADQGLSSFIKKQIQL